MNSKTVFAAWLAFFFAALRGPADAASQPVPKISLAYAPVAAASDSLMLTVRVELAPGWDINSASPLDADLIPAALDVSADGVVFGRPRFPEPLLEHSSVGGGNVSLYRGTFEIVVPARFKSKRRLGSAEASPPTKAVLHYQSCNGGMCYPPKTVEAEWGGAKVTDVLPGKK
jgi:hypothetical protein